VDAEWFVTTVEPANLLCRVMSLAFAIAVKDDRLLRNPAPAVPHV